MKLGDVGGISKLQISGRVFPSDVDFLVIWIDWCFCGFYLII